MISQTSVLSNSGFDLDDRSGAPSRLKRTLVLSLVLHVAVLLVVAGLRLPHRSERPLASVEVSLVSLPAPAVQAEPAKLPDPKPVPAPPVKTATASAAPPKGETKRDMLRDLQLPPDAPKFGDLSPAPKFAAQPQQAAKMKIPDLPRVPDVTQDQAAKIPPRASVSDELNRELEEELKKVRQFQPAAKLDVPKEMKPSEAPVRPALQQEVKAPAVKTPETTLKISGTTGSNSYWARVQSIISSHWEPPPIDMAGQTYTMTVKFRLHRDGTIKDVVVQQSSGNAYYDMAGQRAVLRPRLLPAFPSDMPDSSKDVEMVFRVGEPAG